MASIVTALGLRASNPLTPPPSLASSFMIFHFLFAYAALSSRLWKQYYGFDHNVNPREDVAKFGMEGVKSGKITQAKLNQIKRVESCHANSVEHYPVFASAVIWAQFAGLPTTTINAFAWAYTVARLCYSAVYIFVETPMLSQARGICWWASNIVCLMLYWLGGNAINTRASR